MSSNINTYEKALDYMMNKQSLGIKPGLNRIKEILNNPLLNPQNSFKTIHIAGTNGKGTVGATLANALTENGYKVGFFSSPWVIDYREQIQINGKYIPKKNFTGLVRALDLIQNDCTEFECLTIMAYLYFEIKSVDYAVIECGMGGMNDATNVENKNLSVITPISLDHTNFFGNNIESIAEEKSGILRKNSACILYGDEFKSHFENKCKKLIISPSSDNLSIVNTALNELLIPSVDSLVQLPARCERINGILLDGGHNTSSAAYLSRFINNEIAIIGMMKDKDADSYLSVVASKCKKIISVTVDYPRSMSAAELASMAKKYCSDVSIIENPIEALNDNKVTLVCGSFYLARQIRKKLLSL